MNIKEMKATMLEVHRAENDARAYTEYAKVLDDRIKLAYEKAAKIRATNPETYHEVDFRHISIAVKVAGRAYRAVEKARRLRASYSGERYGPSKIIANLNWYKNKS